MSNEVQSEYSGKACKDVLAYLKGEKDKQEFVSSYKKNAAKSLDYVDVVSCMMSQKITDVCNRNNAEKRLGISKDEFDILSFEQSKHGAVEKIVDAVYDVAYTKIPSNDLGGDGKPVSYDRRRNEGLAAERSLDSLSRIGEYGLGMSALRDAYFFPRKNVPNTGMTKNETILDMVKDDANRCRASNQQKIALLNRGMERK